MVGASASCRGYIPGKLAAFHTAALLRPPDTGTGAACPVRLGETGRAGRALAPLGQQSLEHGEARIAPAAPRLAQDDPEATTAPEPALAAQSRQLADLAGSGSHARGDHPRRARRPAAAGHALERREGPARNAGRCCQACSQASRSALMVAAWVVGMPCGKPW